MEVDLENSDGDGTVMGDSELGMQRLMEQLRTPAATVADTVGR